MSDYRRLYIPGGTYFFTVVTANRAPIFSDAMAVDHLRQAVANEQRQRPFNIAAAVVLPDHLHTIWTLPAGDKDYSIRWSAIKGSFTRAYLASGGVEQTVTAGQRRKQHRGIWQPRFMEHTCRDEDDLTEHINYVHYNPVKHGLTARATDWPYSSIHRYIASGSLPCDWGAVGCEEPGGAVDAELLE